MGRLRCLSRLVGNAKACVLEISNLQAPAPFFIYDYPDTNAFNLRTYKQPIGTKTIDIRAQGDVYGCSLRRTAKLLCAASTAAAPLKLNDINKMCV